MRSSKKSCVCLCACVCLLVVAQKAARLSIAYTFVKVVAVHGTLGNEAGTGSRAANQQIGYSTEKVVDVYTFPEKRTWKPCADQERSW